MKIKSIMKILCICFLILFCGILTACDVPNNDETPTTLTHSQIIKLSFKCTEDQAKEIEKILDKCELKIQDTAYVSREKTKDIGSSFAYKIKYNIMFCETHTEEYYYIHLDFDKKVKHIEIWSEFLYKNYTFKQTFTTAHNNMHEPRTVTFNMGLKNIIYRGDTTQSVKYGDYATQPTFYEGTATYANFLGWTIDGYHTINVSAYPIKEDTTFIALWRNTTFFETDTFVESGNDESTDNIDFEASRTTGNWRG